MDEESFLLLSANTRDITDVAFKKGLIFEALMSFSL